MRRGQNIRVRQKNIFTILKGLVIEQIHSGVKLALCNLRFQGTGGDKSRTGRIYEQSVRLHLCKGCSHANEKSYRIAETGYFLGFYEN